MIAAAAKVSDDLGVPLKTVIIGPGREVTDIYYDWARLREVNEDGVLLVRPDKFIGWRSMSLPADPELSLRDALTALVNAAIMAGENVGESIVRKVFSTALDFVVHLDRDDVNRLGPDEEARRQVMEVLAVVPAMTDDFSTEPIFVREALGKALVWTGAYPPEVELIERSLPEGTTMTAILEGRIQAPFPGSRDEGWSR